MTRITKFCLVQSIGGLLVVKSYYGTIEGVANLVGGSTYNRIVSRLDLSIVPSCTDVGVDYHHIIYYQSSSSDGEEINNAVIKGQLTPKFNYLSQFQQSIFQGN